MTPPLWIGENTPLILLEKHILGQFIITLFWGILITAAIIGLAIKLINNRHDKKLANRTIDQYLRDKQKEDEIKRKQSAYLGDEDDWIDRD